MREWKWGLCGGGHVFSAVAERVCKGEGVETIMRLL